MDQAFNSIDEEAAANIFFARKNIGHNFIHFYI